MKVSLKDGSIKEVTFHNAEGKAAFRHTTAHILAQAVKRLYPDTKCAIGPAIENGFYYDFEFSFHFTDSHLKDVEDEMKKNMYTALIDGEPFAIKPMNCPGGMLVYKMQPRSYRELPMRVCELGNVHRHEKSGQLHGLMRVRSFTQDDAHIFMTQDQIKDEIKRVVRMIDEVYAKFGFRYHVELSTRPVNSIGSDEDWEMAESALENALLEMELPYSVNKGDGAFYGPKIDFHLEDSIKRTWQCGTIQLDFQLPLRFHAEYTGADDRKHRSVMLHRVILGSIERFIGILIEHYAGKFPIWLAPQQARLLLISDRFEDYALLVSEYLQKVGIRCDVDNRDEKLGFKIREAQIDKIPFMLVIGEKEVSGGRVAVRQRDIGDLGSMTTEEFVSRFHILLNSDSQIEKSLLEL